MSQITTHVLDTTRGLPARDLPITLYQQSPGAQGADSQVDPQAAPQKIQWEQLASGTTNSDGRIPDLLEPGRILPAGCYRMHFDTQAYFDANGESGFYPYVDIVFAIGDQGDHYHIPLLLTAYGYSTYRGN